MKLIVLTKGKVAIVDDVDFARVAQYKWQAEEGTRTWYAIRKFKTPQGRQTIGMHNFIMRPKVGIEVDHRDGDGLNNQRNNLRNCTHRQNSMNRRVDLRETKHSRYKGVTLTRVRSNPWMAYIYVNQKRILLGWHPTQEAAAVAYNLAAQSHFGEFARLNVL